MTLGVVATLGLLGVSVRPPQQMTLGVVATLGLLGVSNAGWPVALDVLVAGCVAWLLGHDAFPFVNGRGRDTDSI
jgi:hypothetical protein